MTLWQDHRRCHAIAKSTGKRCGKIALSGRKVCQLHGGRGGNPHIKEMNEKNKEANKDRMKENQLATLHAANAKKILTPEELEVYAEVVEACRQQYALDGAADEMVVNEVGHYAAKIYTARANGAAEHVVTSHSNKILKLLQQLNVRKDCRDAKGDLTGKESPQAFLVRLVEQAKAQKAQLTASVSIAIDGRDNAESRALPADRHRLGAIDISGDQEPALVERIAGSEEGDE